MNAIVGKTEEVKEQVDEMTSGDGGAAVVGGGDSGGAAMVEQQRDSKGIRKQDTVNSLTLSEVVKVVVQNQLSKKVMVLLVV